MTTTAHRLAEFLVDWPRSKIPTVARKHAAMLVASTLASAARGTQLRSPQIIRELAEEKGGAPHASLWFSRGPRLPVGEVVRANAHMSDAAASDDSDLRCIVHLGTPMTATVLALAEKNGASGADVIDALVLGYEVGGRIASEIRDFRPRGYHACVGAGVAAAAAAARMLRLDVDQAAMGLSLTASSVGGLNLASITSWAREYQAALAAQAGINAMLAAQKGFLGEESIYEGKKGFLEMYGGVEGEASGQNATRDFGDSWDIVTDMAIKLMPGGHPFHSISTAAANAAREIGAKPDEVKRIVMSTFRKTYAQRHPKRRVDMVQSEFFFAAAGVADGGVTWAHDDDAKINDPVIHALEAKIEIGPAPTVDRERYQQGATMTVETFDGRSATNTVFAPMGAGSLGIEWDDVAEKYRYLVPSADVGRAEMEASFKFIRAIDGAADIMPLVKFLRYEGA